MAHARVTDWEASLLEQLARGRFVRYCYNVPLLLAVDRTNEPVADLIDGEVSVNKPAFIAPCNGKVVRVAVNAVTYPTTSGAATVKAVKAVIGDTDVDLNTAIDIDNPTDETAIDGTLSSTASDLDILEGQLVYILAALSATTSVDSSGLVAMVEFVPTDNKV